jgi:hypothetical protein
MRRSRSERLRATRLLMVLSSISPLFILWAIRGNKVLPEWYFVSACGFLVIAPNLVLWLRIRTARRQNDKRTMVCGKAEDHRDHLLVYLIAILLPFYSANLGTARELGAALIAICFIVFLFWNMNLHYMNLAFAVFGYRVFTVMPPQDGNPVSGQDTFVVITRRAALEPGTHVSAFRISDTVFLET